MTIDEASRRRRIWARLTLFGAFACLTAGAMIWAAHFHEYFTTGHIHHKSLGSLLGLHHPLLETTLCLLLPASGMLLLYAFVAIWSAGVYRGEKRAEQRIAEATTSEADTIEAQHGRS